MLRSFSVFFVLWTLAAGCTNGPGGTLSPSIYPTVAKNSAPEPPVIVYVGSSTVANFLRLAEPIYGRVRFQVDTTPESLGGERVFQDGHADLAGMACEPSAETLDRGIQALEIGTDALLVVVHPANAVTRLTTTQLHAVFTGDVKNWQELGGPNLEVRPYITAPDSATYRIFKERILGKDTYGDCEVVRPDSHMTMTVESDPGSIGVVSYSFVCLGGSVRVLQVDGQAALPDNERYPLLRPLYFLWRPGNPAVEDFLAWLKTSAAQDALEKCFGKPRKKA